jgi:hypothetical protein
MLDETSSIPQLDKFNVLRQLKLAIKLGKATFIDEGPSSTIKLRSFLKL